MSPIRCHGNNPRMKVGWLGWGVGNRERKRGREEEGQRRRKRLCDTIFPPMLSVLSFSSSLPLALSPLPLRRSGSRLYLPPVESLGAVAATTQASLIQQVPWMNEMTNALFSESHSEERKKKKPCVVHLPPHSRPPPTATVVGVG